MAVATVLFAVATLAFLWKDFADQRSLLITLYGTWAAGWLVVYFAFGLPAHVVLALLGLQGVSHYLIAGAVVGACLGLLYLAFLWDVPRAEVDRTPIGVLRVVGLYSAYGAAAAAAFWFTAVRRSVRRSAV